MPDIRTIIAVSAFSVAALGVGGSALLLRDNQSKALKLAEMSGELQAQRTAAKATQDALSASIQAKDKVSHEYTTIIQKLPATSENCRNDPAIIAAYAGIRRMRDSGQNPVRDPARGPPP